MHSVGEQLRKARLEKDLSIDEVYRQTKIHSRVLEALEQDRAHNFLSFVYIKGFLRTYAQYLGLNSEGLLKEYIDSRQEQALPAPVPFKKKEQPFPKINRLLSLRATATLVVFVGFIIYFRFVHTRISQTKTESETQVAALMQADLPKVKVKVRPEAAPADAVAVKRENLVLQVKTLDSCWLRVRTDNRSVFEKVLAKGKIERWQAKEKIELRIGKPEALELFLNEERIDLKKAQVKRSLVITREGIKGQ